MVWETLNNIEGDGQFVDGEFRPVPPQPEVVPMSLEEKKHQEDQDYLLALSLQEESKKAAEKVREWEHFKTASGMEGLTDEQLAARLQAEEDAQTAALVNRQQQQQQQLHQQQLTAQQQQERSHSKMSNLSNASMSRGRVGSPNCPVERSPSGNGSGAGGEHDARRRGNHATHRHESGDGEERRSGKKQSVSRYRVIATLLIDRFFRLAVYCNVIYAVVL